MLNALATVPLLLLLSSAAPPTRAEPTSDTLFGAKVEDPYRWLEDASKPEVQQWMTAQDGFARAALGKLAGRDAYEKRLQELLYAGDLRLPVQRAGRVFHAKRTAGKEKTVLFWRAGDGGADRVLLDPSTLSADGSVALGAWVPSPDGKKLAYLLKPNNADAAVIHVLDVASGEVSKADVISGGRYARPSWAPDSRGFYYVNLPDAPGVAEADLPGLQEVRFHALGSDPKADPILFPAKHDPELGIGADVSHDGHWLVVSLSRGWSQNELWVRDLRKPAANFSPLFQSKTSLAGVEVVNDAFFVLTNDGAPRYRIFRVDPAHLERAAWKEIVPERKDAVIEDMQVVGKQLVLTLQGQLAAERLELRDLDGGHARAIAVPGLGVIKQRYDEDAASGEPDQPQAFFQFSSPIQPKQIWRLDVASGKIALWDEVKLPFDPSKFAVDTVWYPSKDGTKISMFIVRRKDLAKSAATPFILYGYGGFNISESPSFDARILPWVEAGNGFAVAQLRGGGEYGEAWHQAGMGAHKQNVFDDFEAAAEFLIRDGQTSAAHLSIKGGSNGGLLVSTAMTQRPELFGAVICQVPLTDMIRYTRFGEGKTWAPEYGSPEVAAEFQTLASYSPYHHVKSGVAYPALLMLSADHDDRVDPLHARKFVAMVQSRSIGTRPALLRIERNAGHGGADLVKQAASQYADVYAFLAHELGASAGH